MKKIHQKQERNPSNPLVWEVEKLASAAECTGLVPTAIQTPEEAEEYSRLYAIHLQKTAETKEATSKPNQKETAE